MQYIPMTVHYLDQSDCRQICSVSPTNVPFLVGSEQGEGHSKKEERGDVLRRMLGILEY